MTPVRAQAPQPSWGKPNVVVEYLATNVNGNVSSNPPTSDGSNEVTATPQTWRPPTTEVQYYARVRAEYPWIGDTTPPAVGWQGAVVWGASIKITGQPTSPDSTLPQTDPNGDVWTGNVSYSVSWLCDDGYGSGIDGSGGGMDTPGTAVSRPSALSNGNTVWFVTDPVIVSVVGHPTDASIGKWSFGATIDFGFGDDGPSSGVGTAGTG